MGPCATAGRPSQRGVAVWRLHEAAGHSASSPGTVGDAAGGGGQAAAHHAHENTQKMNSLWIERYDSGCAEPAPGLVLYHTAN